MPLTIKLTWAPSTNPTSHLLPSKLLTPSESSSAIFFPRASTPSPPHRTLIAKCTTGGAAREGGGLKKALSGIVGEQVEELLKREENRELLEGLEKASQRVEIAKRELAEIGRQELEAKLVRDYIAQLESRASENVKRRYQKQNPWLKKLKVPSHKTEINSEADILLQRPKIRKLTRIKRDGNP